MDALLDSFLDKHGATVDPATKRKLDAQLRKARAVFGDRHPDSLNRLELEDWRATLPAGSRPDVFREREDDSNTARLIADIRNVFTNGAGDRLRTADLIAHLAEIEESPWGDWSGKTITAQGLSRLLRPFRIKTMPVKVEGQTVRAGVEHRRVNDMRHTFATWAIEEGSVHLWQLAKIMGTSVAQLEDTYARWLKRTDDQLRAALDAYDRKVSSAVSAN